MWWLEIFSVQVVCSLLTWFSNSTFVASFWLQLSHFYVLAPFLIWIFLSWFKIFDLVLNTLLHIVHFSSFLLYIALDFQSSFKILVCVSFFSVITFYSLFVFTFLINLFSSTNTLASRHIIWWQSFVSVPSILMADSSLTLHRSPISFSRCSIEQSV